MKEVTCYHCGTSEHTLFASENGFQLVKCTGCGLLYVTPRPDEDEINSAHRCGVHRGQRELHVTGLFNEKRINRYLEILGDFFPDRFAGRKVSWLDIGCGHGEFLIALNRFTGGNIETRGLEPNDQKAAAARSRGLDVSLFDLNTDSRRYDYVSALNVYSHLPNPPAMLGGWPVLFRPGGELFLETGDTADLSPKRHPRPFHLPDHLSFASRSIITSVLEQAGYEILDVRSYHSTKPTPVAVAKEILKIVWPGKRSIIRHMFLRSDLFVRARFARPGAD